MDKKTNPVNYITPRILDILNKANEIDLNLLDKHSSNRFKIPGVYFLYRKNDIVYIGSSKDIFNRLEYHYKDEVKVFDSYSYVEINENEYEIMERFLINKYLPIYNKDGVTNKVKKILQHGIY